MRLHRVIPILLHCNGSIVRSYKFSNHYSIGDPHQQLERYLSWGVDEIIYLDISPNAKGFNRLIATCPTLFDSCFTPIATGGGIRTLNDIEQHLEFGSDRVVIGSMALQNPKFVEDAAKRFGSQAIIVSADYRVLMNKPRIFYRNGKYDAGILLYEWIVELQERGAGEIILNSIDRDGFGGGFDLNTISDLSQKLTIPLIACGGASSYEHFADAILHGASAVAASNIFNFKELAYQHAKEAMIGAGIFVRPPCL